MMNLFNKNSWMYLKYKKVKFWCLIGYIKISNFILNTGIFYIKTNK